MSVKRGAKARNLGQNCREDVSTGMVSCELCFTSTGAELRTWLQRGSWTKHLDTGAHLAAVARASEAERNKAALKDEYDGQPSVVGGQIVDFEELDRVDRGETDAPAKEVIEVVGDDVPGSWNIEDLM
ncbi:hypothetical protein B0H10DRAFT_1959903 [Mycena sp. CBHHK59/15]|nr:hypothetical protein B0H10DRAFT_1959903 [Mycena sp. CBHHK59/15]